MNQSIERRFSGQLRAEQRSDGKRILRGTAITYNSLSLDLGGFRERILPGSVAKSIRKNDVRFLADHDSGKILGRVSAGTLALWDTAAGLTFEVQLPNTSAGDDTLESVSRGDLNQCSFGFRCLRELWSEEKNPDCDDEDDDDYFCSVRSVAEADVFELSVVAMPAYPTTSAEIARAMMFPGGLPQEVRTHVQARGIPSADQLRRRADAEASSVIDEDEAVILPLRLLRNPLRSP